jgi:hypothetical protein
VVKARIRSMPTKVSYNPQFVAYVAAAHGHGPPGEDDWITSYYIHTHLHTPHPLLVESVLQAAKPPDSCVFVCLFACLFPSSLLLTTIVPRSTDWQAGASLVWGHEKSEFEDDQGSQLRAWYNECGRAFKIKAAWGHPDIVRTAARARVLKADLRADVVGYG